MLFSFGKGRIDSGQLHGVVNVFLVRTVENYSEKVFDEGVKSKLTTKDWSLNCETLHALMSAL